MTQPSPSARSLLGIALIILLIALWALLIAGVSSTVGNWPVLVQSAFYLVVGIVWIIPLKPLVRWIVSGNFRAPRPGRPD